MSKVGYYSRAERKRQIVWHLLNAWVRHSDVRWTVSRIARVLDMAKSQHLLLILRELEMDGAANSQLEPFRGLPRRIYAPTLEGIQLLYPDLWREFVAEGKQQKKIVVNVGGVQSEMFANWR